LFTKHLKINSATVKIVIIDFKRVFIFHCLASSSGLAASSMFASMSLCTSLIGLSFE